MKNDLLRHFPQKTVVSLFFLIKMADCVNIICHFIEDIDNHSFIYGLSKS